jgi:hypothetical protein
MTPAATSPSHPKHKAKPAVPLRSEKPLMGLTSNKNYITSNASKQVQAVTPACESPAGQDKAIPGNESRAAGSLCVDTPSVWGRKEGEGGKGCALCVTQPTWRPTWIKHAWS